VAVARRSTVAADADLIAAASAEQSAVYPATVSSSEQPRKEEGVTDTVLGMATEVRPEQPSKSRGPRTLALPGNTMDSSKEQPLNALGPMLVTLSKGVAMDASEEQSLKAPALMNFTLLGMARNTSEGHLEKASSPMVARTAVLLGPRSTVFRPEQP
jgi:hypothetical protein